MTRITHSQMLRRATSILGGALLVIALTTLAADAAYADNFSSCDQVKFGKSGQVYAFKDGC